MNRRFRTTFEGPFWDYDESDSKDKNSDGSIVVYDNDSNRFGRGLIISGPLPPDKEDNTKEGT